MHALRRQINNTSGSLAESCEEISQRSALHDSVLVSGIMVVVPSLSTTRDQTKTRRLASANIMMHVVPHISTMIRSFLLDPSVSPTRAYMRRLAFYSRLPHLQSQSRLAERAG